MTWKLELIKKYWRGCGQKWCSHSVLWTVKISVCHGGMNGISWFFLNWCFGTNSGKLKAM